MKDKITKKNGFTMAELLIVVAIIAVLVAVAIPIFNKQLEKSREAYDVATMRQAASLATQYFYAGVGDDESARAAGLKWWDNGYSTDPRKANQANAAGVYDPKTSSFKALQSTDSNAPAAYGKGTGKDSGKTYTYNDSREIYSSKEDYTRAVVMVAIYPYGDNPHIDVYWKNRTNPNAGKYVGSDDGPNNPAYSIRINND